MKNNNSTKEPIKQPSPDIKICPCCGSNNVRKDYDFKEMRCCDDCGADFHKDGDITLDPRLY